MQHSLQLVFSYYVPKFNLNKCLMTISFCVINRAVSTFAYANRFLWKVSEIIILSSGLYIFAIITTESEYHRLYYYHSDDTCRSLNLDDEPSLGMMFRVNCFTFQMDYKFWLGTKILSLGLHQIVLIYITGKLKIQNQGDRIRIRTDEMIHITIMWQNNNDKDMTCDTSITCFNTRCFEMNSKDIWERGTNEWKPLESDDLEILRFL